MHISQLPERISSKISVDRLSGCWVWVACRYPNGYGQIYWDGKMRLAHRIVYTLLIEEIPKGLDIDHLCRNRSCVNPKHLEPVTHRENVMRGNSPVVDQVSRTHCPQGHELSGSNLVASMLKDNKRACRQCRKELGKRRAELFTKARRVSGLTCREYFDVYGWSVGAAEKVLLGC